ncbi:Oligosaccharide translocation protein rft1 [Elasticomyces elasticus]|uniref:Man(5)GlcNAc(2)-PP-dolichol translocation protein RFT1 n=1 Tax=Exophiala sideris TaxID=1016849 RepID=A0ABR0JAG1_9EURO|nr:Oligosaccharide translocation protein rft1 [Elasticomyces elasticus]KAK5030335.1 Oligosaccharide translocation protein rft1 [Exophiala sideris]KAK5038388.1 Oligosaccharide translocation protein rft1 [Exophiala sideris]KAK5060271.1 Oligosaccharide translocation protein rft1 [Exophiala sideris]KAK5183182.1 Oligosaccharide translocation protein rft1 [Eurotiomycetes sp. CCFEE 6388]
MADKAEPRPPGSGTLLLILIQVASRALTFIGNQFLLRFLSPSLLGIAVQLELVSVTSLYFARESLRVALQRQPPASHGADSNGSSPPGKDSPGKNTQTVVNLSYLAVLLGFGVSTAFGYSYIRSAPSEVLESPYFDISFQIYAAATLVELLAEPAFVVIQQKALYADRARAETSAAMARCFSACIVAVICHRRALAPSILPFAVGQAAYALVLLTLYLVPVLHLSRHDHFDLTPRKIGATPAGPGTDGPETYYSGFFHRAILSLAATMYMQSIFKLLLTQGDALILSFLSSLADQGAFALASNYGGLLARLVFQPVEESSRNTFGRLLSVPATTTDSPKSGTTTTSQDNVRQALHYLANTLHFYLLMALPLVSIAPYILPLVVKHIIGAGWYTSSTAALLATYCYYIPLMAVNGILDAFVTSVATPTQLRAQSGWMLLFTGIYGVGAWAMLKKFELGAAGLVGANMVNMVLRIIWSLDFLRRWVSEHDKAEEGLLGQVTRESLPASASVTVTGLVILASRLQDLGGPTQDNGELNRQFLGFQTASIVLLGSTILFAEREFLIQMLESIVPQRLAAKIPGLNKRRQIHSSTSSTSKQTKSES